MEILGLMFWLFLWFLFGLIGAAMLSSRNKAGTGCLLGGLLGPIGLIIVAIMMASEPRPSPSPNASPADTRPKKKCPECAELVYAEATKCRYCGHVFGETA